MPPARRISRGSRVRSRRSPPRDGPPLSYGLPAGRRLRNRSSCAGDLITAGGPAFGRQPGRSCDAARRAHPWRHAARLDVDLVDHPAAFLTQTVLVNFAAALLAEIATVLASAAGLFPSARCRGRVPRRAGISSSQSANELARARRLLHLREGAVQNMGQRMEDLRPGHLLPLPGQAIATTSTRTVWQISGATRLSPPRGAGKRPPRRDRRLLLRLPEPSQVRTVERIRARPSQIEAERDPDAQATPCSQTSW